MKRYYDVIIVGTGLAGLFAALNLKSDLSILMITNKKVRASNSYIAQGGVSVLRDENDFESFVEDTLKAGGYENDIDSVEEMVELSRDSINDLIKYGVEFESENGELSYTREGAHSNYRVLHYKDMTGREIIDKVLKTARKRKNIKIFENTQMVDLIIDDNRCDGIVLKIDEELKNIYSNKVVMATGGVGGMFENTTNFTHIKGDGVNVCLNNNIKCEKLSYIQIHPTSLYLNNKGRRFLISETLRGEGAYLLNSKGERFVDELLPRNVVSDAIYSEMKKNGEKNVYLSFNHKGVKFVKHRFPNIYRRCNRVGFELGREWIPVTPAQHYFMGGISIDTCGKTTLKNLYAVGETSYLGIHGANRLASNSLLECLVFSKKAAININNSEFNYFDLIKTKIPSVKENLDDSIFKNILKEEDAKFYKKWFE